MNRNEQYYRKIVGSIGVTMLFFLLFINVFGMILRLFQTFLDINTSENDMAYDVAYQIFYAVGYLLSFMLPVLILKKLIRKSGYVYQPMQAEPRLSPWIFLLIPAGITVIFSAAFLNSAMVEIFSYNDFMSEMMGSVTDEKPAVYQFVLEFIVMCVVPGFCEEFLFRGAIQTNCRPFGRTNAILISSLLFALMHQNAGQIFYAFVAGVFLGAVYEKTGSIWNCTLLHILNNFASSFEGMIFYKMESLFQSTLAITLFEVTLFAVGAISLAILIPCFFAKRNDLSGGIFGRDLPASDGYSAVPIASKRAVKLFLTPSMIVFLILCVIEIVGLILLSVVFPYAITG